MDNLIETLNTYKNYQEDDFFSNTTIQLSTERALEICINICIDIRAHILTSIGNNNSNTYKDIFINLGKEQIISIPFAKKLSKMASFRNFLDHFYMELDVKRVYHFLQRNLDDFILYKKEILKFLASSDNRTKQSKEKT
ncbi:MAG: type VII toxin-antitoxin system HepT family RNase toxin [Promethearchaeota archaeon]